MSCMRLCVEGTIRKQALWWTLTQPEPGVLTWTTPHGRSHTVTPEPYLVWPVLLPGPGVARTWVILRAKRHISGCRKGGVRHPDIAA